MEKVLENLDGKVTEVGSSICEVIIMMKMLEMQVGQLAEQPKGDKEEFRDNPVRVLDRQPTKGSTRSR
jgi:hypothetical protein